MLVSAGIRVLVCALSAAMSTCHAPLLRTAAVPAQPGPSAPPAQLVRRFDPDVARVDPASPLGRLRATSEESPEAAVELARELLQRAEGAERARIAWVGARAAQRAGLPERAAELLAEVAVGGSPLAPWARLSRARILTQAGSQETAAAAVEEVRPLTEMAWAGQRSARDLYATALVRAGRGDEAEPLLRALLAEAGEGSARASVAMPLAELLAARGAPEARIEAVRLFRRVALLAPLSRAAREAEARAEAIVASLTPEQRRALGDPSPADAIARAEALESAMRFDDAEEAFAAVANAEDPSLRCRALLGRGRAVYYQRDRRRAAGLLASVADECEEPDVRAWARYLSAKAYAASGDPARALAQYGELERQVPEHRLADDARFRSALIDAARGDRASMEERLRTLPERYPSGDMHGEARFLLAWRARADGRLEEALAHLDASLREGTGEAAEDVHGRAAYWRAVVLAELGRTDEARDAWTALALERPLAYYAQQAMARLRELSPAAAESARAALGARGDGSITFEWRSELDSPAFARAIELLLVGEIDAARDELSWVYESSDRRDEELRWIQAALLDRAGAHPAAVWLARRHLASFMTAPPSGEHYARWRIAYPRAYAPIIEEAARSRSIPPELVFAIAREESSFRPDAVSVAHAYGLTQLILPTARRFGRPLGLRIDAGTLTDPRVNVAVGSEYMAWLWARYEANPAVLPSAYNAGQGATDRWLRERPDRRLDEWIEEIPYDETRRYTRRVLQTWGIYAWLDRGELIDLRAALPPAP